MNIGYKPERRFCILKRLAIVLLFFHFNLSYAEPVTASQGDSEKETFSISLKKVVFQSKNVHEILIKPCISASHAILLRSFSGSFPYAVVDWSFSQSPAGKQYIKSLQDKGLFAYSTANLPEMNIQTFLPTIPFTSDDGLIVSIFDGKSEILLARTKIISKGLTLSITPQYKNNILTGSLYCLETEICGEVCIVCNGTTIELDTGGCVLKCNNK